MMKSGLKFMGVGLILLGMAVPVRATFVVTDVFRSLEKVLEDIDRLTQSISEEMKNAAKEIEIKVWSEEKEVSTKPTAGAYDFLFKTPLSSLESAKIAPAQDDMEKAREFVKKTFFLPEGSEPTDAEKQAINAIRQEYVSLLAQEQLTLAAGIQDSIQADMEALQKAEGSGAGILQEIKLDTQTVKTSALMSAANVVLGIKVMELDAAQLLLDKDPVLLPEVKTK